ncbi:hypothetical protein FJO69_01685 [[Mycoplasma] falconis]|uniref:Membrane protein P80 n=1 Tax=[Mycoplasma] falconis TaxID=92403 RepID=A0A501XA62_9BACT|nr:hypothetical protein [[Mycoplasma] falconis]TPE57445.1 hypothetical protein FJO69_01685 [[Mycoplasma] falconis]
MSDKKIRTTEQKAKRKRILWGAFWGTAITAAVSAGIAIPIVQAQKKLPQPTPVLTNDDAIISIVTPNGKNYNLNYGDLDKNHNELNGPKYIASQVEKFLTKYLYEQEYKGSLWYEAVYNADKAENKRRSFALDSIDKIKSENTKKINDLEKKIQEDYGLEKKWDEKFKEELASSQYGNAKSKEEAIEYLTTKQMESNAYRRYQTEVNKDWTYSELKNGIIANRDIYYTYNGEKIEVAKQGETITLSFAKENVNYVLPLENSEELLTENKDQLAIPMFVTKSFVADQKEASRFITPWIERKQAIISDFKLASKPNKDDVVTPWSVSKDEVIKLLSYNAFVLEDKNKVEVAQGIDKIATFSGISPLIIVDETKQEEWNKALIKANNDAKLLEFVSSDKSAADQYGSIGFQNIFSQLQGKEAKEYIPLISILLGDATETTGIYKYNEQNELFTNLKEELNKSLLEIIKNSAGENSQTYKDLKNALDSTNSKELNKTDLNSNNIATLNDTIKNTINSMIDSDFNKAISKVYQTVFSTNNPDNKISSIIKVKDNYLRVTSDGILLQNVYYLSDVNKVNSLIIHDLTIQSKSNYNGAFKKEVLNLNNIFNEILTKDFQVADLLSQDEFINYIKEQSFIQQETNEERKFTQEDIEKAIEYEKLVKQADNSSLINNKAKQIESFVKNEFNSGIYADWKATLEADNQYKWELAPHTNQKPIDYLFKTINDFINSNLSKKLKSN